MKRLLTILLCITMLFSLTACNEWFPGKEMTFREAAADFSFTLFENLELEKGKNVLISPLSALACIGMVTGGAEGDTLRQLEKVLGLDEETLTPELCAYLRSLYTGEDCTFHMANSIWTKDSDDKFHVNEEFLTKITEQYDAQIFRNPFDAATVEEINAWAAEHTDGMIDHLFDELSPQSLMVLINALVFDAKWEEPYTEHQVKQREFTNYGGNKQSVNMMYSSESVYLETRGAVGFAKPYQDNKYSFVALLPNEGKDVYRFAQGLDGDDFLKMWDERSRATIRASLPEFGYEDGYSLMEALREMGVTDLFDAEKADLSGIGSYEGQNIYCSAIEQKTCIEVTPAGTKAAAVTWIAAPGAGEPQKIIEIYLDRPFVYAIVDNATGLPLFVGIVADVAK